MSRSLTASLLAQITAAVVRPVFFYQGEFASGTVRLWSGVGPITWNGNTWTGAGDLISLSTIDENSEIRAAGFTVSLNGQSASILSLSMAQVRHGLSGKVWIGALDSAGAIVSDPFLAFSGRADAPEIVDEGESATISLAYESRLIDLDKTRERRYTHEDQQIDYAGDYGFEYIPKLQDAQFNWGRGRSVPAAAPSSAPTSGSAGAYWVEGFEGVGGGWYDANGPVGTTPAGNGGFDPTQVGGA